MIVLFLPTGASSLTVWRFSFGGRLLIVESLCCKIFSFSDNGALRNWISKWKYNFGDHPKLYLWCDSLDFGQCWPFPGWFAGACTIVVRYSLEEAPKVSFCGPGVDECEWFGRTEGRGEETNVRNINLLNKSKGADWILFDIQEFCKNAGQSLHARDKIAPLSGCWRHSCLFRGQDTHQGHPWHKEFQISFFHGHLHPGRWTENQIGSFNQLGNSYMDSTLSPCSGFSGPSKEGNHSKRIFPEVEQLWWLSFSIIPRELNKPPTMPVAREIPQQSSTCTQHLKSAIHPEDLTTPSKSSERSCTNSHSLFFISLWIQIKPLLPRTRENYTHKVMLELWKDIDKDGSLQKK